MAASRRPSHAAVERIPISNPTNKNPTTPAQKNPRRWYYLGLASQGDHPVRAAPWPEILQKNKPGLNRLRKTPTPNEDRHKQQAAQQAQLPKARPPRGASVGPFFLVAWLVGRGFFSRLTHPNDFVSGLRLID